MIDYYDEIAERSHTKLANWTEELYLRINVGSGFAQQNTAFFSQVGEHLRAKKPPRFR